jgi:DNA-binding transcriptional regulator YiaG
MYHYKGCGLPNVWLVNGYTVHDTPYGKGVSIADVDGLQRVIARELVRKPGRLIGREFRFLRGELELSQAKLGGYFGSDAQAVARWESGKTRVPKWADRFLRALYREATDRNPAILEIVERLQDTGEAELGRLRFERGPRAWKAAA